MSNVTKLQIQADVVPCPHCGAVLVLQNGQPQQAVTLWMHNGRPSMTAHTEECVFRGRTIPDVMFPQFIL